MTRDSLLVTNSLGRHCSNDVSYHGLVGEQRSRQTDNLLLFPSTHPPGRMKPREYCCCAIPVINVGIYLTLTEQFVLGILAGTLSVATPSRNCAPILPSSLLRPLCLVVGAATPSFARWIFAAICYVGAMIQVLGFVGVAKVCISPVYSLGCSLLADAGKTHTIQKIRYFAWPNYGSCVLCRSCVDCHLGFSA